MIRDQMAAISHRWLSGYNGTERKNALANDDQGATEPFKRVQRNMKG